MEDKKKSKKATSRKTNEKKVRKTDKKQTTKKKKKAFTLIELLAVIIILGILMIIAIPSVTSYINSSRKSAYVDTAKEIVAGARNFVNEGKLEMYDTGVTYYIKASCISTENGQKSPYGEFTESYVGVTYDGHGYNYYWVSNDTSGQGVREITPIDKLDIDKIETNINDAEIREKVEKIGIDERNKILILNDDCSDWENELVASLNLNNEGEIESNEPELANFLIENYPNNFHKYYGLVTDKVGSTVNATNVYYANNQTINNVIFANFCWQIVRTTQQGGAKLIYNGTVVNGTCPSGRPYSERIIGQSKFNSNNNSPSYVGYMYNASYEHYSSNDYSGVYGNDVKFENGYYTLLDTSSTRDNNHHYTCNNVNEGNKCETVNYYYYGSYHVKLSNGEKIEDAINNMFYSNNVNKYDSTMKSYIENWYENNLLNYTKMLDNNVYCNDRTIANLDTNGWNKNGSLSINLIFKNNSLGAQLDCPNVVDQFSTSNNKAKLKYPIALITEPERNYSGSDLLKIDTWYWGMSPIYYRYDSLPFVSYVLTSGNFNSGYFYSIDNVSSTTSFANVRPVIALKNSITFSKGNGSNSNPFVVDLQN